MLNLLIVDGKPILPVYTAYQAQGRYFVRGSDKHGDFVACKLDNRDGSKLAGWYVLVSPEDVEIMQKYVWCGNVCGKQKRYILVRRREQTVKGEHDVLLNHEIWKRCNGTDAVRLYLKGHPLDFRRSNIRSASNKLRYIGCRGVTFHENGWQVQICLQKGPVYVGRAKSQEEGFRLYNRHLRGLKEQFPSVPVIQNMPYNEINPLF